MTRATALAIALLLATGCRRTSEGRKPAGAGLTPFQEAVRKHIVARAKDPASVQFSKWEQWTSDEMEAARKARGLPARAPSESARDWAAVVRVCYRVPNSAGGGRLYDRLLIVQHDFTVVGGRGENNPNGDGWKEGMTRPDR
jgi:hypothetical protein